MPRECERLSAKEAERSSLYLNEKDREILLALLDTRFMDTRQVMTLLGMTRQGAQQRLYRLYRHRYLARQSWDLRHIYGLDRLGIEYLAEITGIPPAELHSYRSRNVSRFFLDHALAVSDVYVALKSAARKNNLTLSWRNEIGAADRYTLQSGREQKLEPDAVFALSGDNLSLLAFLEVDRATESWQKWMGKVQDYNAYFLSDRFSERWPPAERVLVLITVPNSQRVDALREFLAEQWRAYRQQQRVPVGIAVQEAVQAEQILTMPWTGPDGMFRLVEEVRGAP